MASLEEALTQSVDNEPIAPVNDVLVIDPEKRLINVPDSESLFGVFGENIVERKYFTCPRIVLNNIDLFECYIFINYISASGRIGYIQANDVVLDETENYIVFSWELTSNVFDKNMDSIIYFSVSAKQYVDDREPVFFTRKAQGKMYETVNGTELIQEQYADIILQLLAKIESVEQIATPEAMQVYVDNWLKENPSVIGGQPVPVESASGMLSTQTLYLYMGKGETVDGVVYERGYVYYYVDDTQSWTKGSLYGGEGGGSSFSGNASDVSYDDTETKLGATNVQEAVGRLSDKKVDNPSTGEIGQILEIESVDDNGKPLTYKAADKPTGGSVSDEQIASAVESYLTENPPQAGASEVPLYTYDWNYSSQSNPHSFNIRNYGSSCSYTANGMTMTKPWLSLLDEETIDTVENFDMELVVGKISSNVVQLGYGGMELVDFKVIFEDATYLKVASEDGYISTKIEHDMEGFHSYRFIKKGDKFSFLYDGELVVENKGKVRTSSTDSWFCGFECYAGDSSMTIQRIRFTIADLKENGTDVTVTKENITNALGYTPADKTEVDNLSETIAELKENGTDYVLTDADIEEIAVSVEENVSVNIPKKTSQLENDSNFVTKDITDALEKMIPTDEHINTLIDTALGKEVTEIASLVGGDA